MTDNTLDAAILIAKKAEWKHHDLPNDAFQNNIGAGDRTYARALIAELLRGMEPPEWFTTDEDCGWDAAISDLRLRVGLEYEV